MHEGQIGKLVVRKSGKIEAIIKNTKYILNVEYAKGYSEVSLQGTTINL